MESIGIIKKIESEINDLNKALNNKQNELRIANVKHAILTDCDDFELCFRMDLLLFALHKESSFLDQNEDKFTIEDSNYSLQHNRGSVFIFFKNKNQLKSILKEFNIDFHKVKVNINLDIDELRNRLKNMQNAIDTYESLNLEFL